MNKPEIDLFDMNCVDVEPFEGSIWKESYLEYTLKWTPVKPDTVCIQIDSISLFNEKLLHDNGKGGIVIGYNKTTIGFINYSTGLIRFMWTEDPSDIVVNYQWMVEMVKGQEKWFDTQDKEFNREWDKFAKYYNMECKDK